MAGGEPRMTGDCGRADGIQPDLYIDAYARIHICMPYVYGLVAFLDSLQSSFSSITISIYTVACVLGSWVSVSSDVLYEKVDLYEDGGCMRTCIRTRVMRLMSDRAYEYALLKAKEKGWRSSIVCRFKVKKNYRLIYERESRKTQCRLPKPEPNAEYQCRALLFAMGAGETGGGRQGWWGQARPMGAVSHRPHARARQH
jgi:hypothetical protein